MLAVEEVSIGDEIEYIYSIRRVYDTYPKYFYDARQVAFSSSFECLEKSIFFESRDFQPNYGRIIFPMD